MVCHQVAFPANKWALVAVNLNYDGNIDERESGDVIAPQKCGAMAYALAKWVESSAVQNFIIVVILINAVVLGMDATPMKDSSAAGIIKLIDTVCLGIFIVEIILRHWPIVLPSAQRLEYF